MSGKVFFDTSVLIYAITEDDARSAQAERLLAAGGNLSVQVLNEFASVAGESSICPGKKSAKLSMPFACYASRLDP